MRPKTDAERAREAHWVQNRAIASLLDVVEELTNAVAEPGFADVVRENFALHRRELLSGEIEEE